MRLQFWHIVVVLVVIVLLFGANRLPDLARSVGQSLKIFKNEVKELREDDTSAPRRDATPHDATAPRDTATPPQSGAGGPDARRDTDGGPRA
ncbi:twin-arginine translocase TatA/TatE family subunit [Cellulomonas sp. APG4]|uniref:Sec-independent protein translocase subunit TatA n=1 Tax=Cellulomonas sp. APG4 TaxID=1538656 RepID=UPI001379B2BC|nr:Sec-independent protein translocase subunit TatA [Cellulomonas sp. APG4]NCT90720.1 twin-arginine translocase TatA/TatE family subunit [Cellulomonas sp. APG4]